MTAENAKRTEQNSCFLTVIEEEPTEEPPRSLHLSNRGGNIVEIWRLSSVAKRCKWEMSDMTFGIAQKKEVAL